MITWGLPDSNLNQKRAAVPPVTATPPAGDHRRTAPPPVKTTPAPAPEVAALKGSDVRALIIAGHGAVVNRAMDKSASQESGGRTLELTLYGVIEKYGDASAAAVKRQLVGGAFSKVRVRLNSPGGDVFEGIAIYNLLRAQGKPVECCVDGLAASAASVVAMAGDIRRINVGGMLMVHNPWSSCEGYASDMRKEADVLDSIAASIATLYSRASGKSVEAVRELMDAETWMAGPAAIAAGFATAVGEKLSPKEASAVAAQARTSPFKAALQRYKHVPSGLAA